MTATAADADGFGGRCNVANQDRGCGAGNSGDGMMLGQPEAPVAPRFRALREVDRARDGGSGLLAGAHADQVEDGNRKRHAALDETAEPKGAGAPSKLDRRQPVA
jgi:hypothetical protein